MSAVAYEPDRPWVRQPFDTDLTWALFSDYLALAIPRRLQDIRPAGYTWTQIERFAAENFWRERAAMWDDHLAEIRTLTIERVTEETAEEVARRQLTLCKAMQELAGLEINSLLKLARKAGDYPGTIQPRDALRFAANGVRLERLIRGEATERTETGPDVSTLSLEELRAARDLQAKAGIR